MALAPRSRWGVVAAVFFVVVVVIGVGQLMYIAPRQGDRGESTVQLELVQLRLEVAGLKDMEGDFKKAKADKQKYEEEVSKLKDDEKDHLAEIAKLSHDLEQMNSQVEQLKKTQTQTSSNTPITTDKELMEAVNAPNNVITHLDTLVLLLKNFNTYGEIRNADKFTLEEGFIPIVIRVYNKHEYFGFALEHYRKVKGIEKTMLVISHDGIFPEMFSLVQSIDFCQVKQVVHPYSGHLLTNRFPGPDTTIPDGRDRFNNPRPFPHTSLKHHFWWHMNFVWDQFLPDHDGNMVFMEEDHIPTVDYYQTVKSLAEIRDKRCPDCFNAKIHQHEHQASGIHDLVLSHDLGNVGMVMHRSKWVLLRKAGKEFCTFDDYNWDWTMAHLISVGAIPKLSLTATFPRAEHLGKCGTHASSGSCSISQSDREHFEKVNKELEEKNGGDWSKYTLKETPIDGVKQHNVGWGGWGHPMDHQLCLDQIKQDT